MLDQSRTDNASGPGVAQSAQASWKLYSLKSVGKRSVPTLLLEVDTID